MEKKSTDAVVKRQDMGLGVLGDPKLLMLRKFRWTLESNVLEATWVSKVEIDYLNRTLAFSVMKSWGSNAKSINAMDFAREVINFTAGESLELTHLDGCGQAISVTSFEQLSVKQAKESLDMSNAGFATVDFVIGYGHCAIDYPLAKKDVAPCALPAVRRLEKPKTVTKK